MAKLTGSLVAYPARVSLIWYAGLVLVGGLLLTHPWCRQAGQRPIAFLDALFTSTSASCVTGLAVRSTEHDYSFVGQLVILLLIQVGGIGIMTVTTLVMFRLGGRENLRRRLLIAETLGADTRSDLRWILRHVIGATLVLEGIGAGLLLVRNLFDLPFPVALWHAVFHSVSAFCNAGFGLRDNSLIDYQGDILVNAVICSLIISGGIGYPVLLDVRRHWRQRWPDCWDQLHLHSKFMLIGTATLLLLGTAIFLILEWDGVLQSVPWWQCPMVAFFHATTCRTAGFNTVDIASLTNAMLFVSILLMAIGAGPCSTAGGLKVSTAAVLVVDAWATFRGQSHVSVFRRTLPRRAIERATATALVFGLVAIVALTSLLLVEQSDQPHSVAGSQFIDAMFEVVSALGTVGLSTGITPSLNPPAKIVLIALMMIGRLGPISVFIALSQTERKNSIEYPGEEPMIG